MLNKFAKSKWMDLVGVVIVVVCAYFSGYMFETLSDVNHINSGISVWLPFGIMSTIASIISLTSDRLQARLKNLGNWVGLIAVVTSGWVDYTLGNKAAPITYVFSFIIQAVAIKVWMNSDRYKANKPLKGWKATVVYVAVIIFALAFSYGTNAIGFGSQRNLLFYTTVIIFAMSLIANILNAMKLTTQWGFWTVYNITQLVKAVVQGNWSNLGKYVYYIFNSICGLSLWHDSTAKNGVKHASTNKAVAVTAK